MHWRRRYGNSVSVLGYRIDHYFHKHKLAIEVDELGQADRNLSK